MYVLSQGGFYLHGSLHSCPPQYLDSHLLQLFHLGLASEVFQWLLACLVLKTESWAIWESFWAGVLLLKKNEARSDNTNTTEYNSDTFFFFLLEYSFLEWMSLSWFSYCP